MDLPLHSRVKSAVSWVNSSRWKSSKATKDANISWQGFGFRILGCAMYYVHRLPWKRIIAAFEGRNRQKTTANEEAKSVLSTKECTVSQVDPNDGKIKWIALWIASTPILFSRSGPQRLLVVWRPQKNGPGKEIWLQWRSDIGNWGVFWGQRQIVQQKRHRIAKEALESVYPPRRKLCWWKKSNLV